MNVRDIDYCNPVTEQSNAISRNIDISPPIEMVYILQQCDKQIFHGWNESKGLNDMNMINKIVKLSSKIADVLKNPSSGMVCIGGCGTSGRLAFIICNEFNSYLQSLGKEPCFRYVMAGDDRALFLSQELAEDDPIAGALVLNEMTKEKSKVVYIGVSCGLSASFVAGQLDYCLNDLNKFTPTVLGFNPIYAARELPIPNWDKTFRSVLHQISQEEQEGKSFILNPIIGPDPITGSSRMKSGSATRILLEIVALASIHHFNQIDIQNLLQCYEEVYNSVYDYRQQMTRLIELAGNSLRSVGHVYYLGCGGKALMAMVDASECPPTYGADFDDVRGFIDGGYDALNNVDGDLSSKGEQFRISLQDFEQRFLPSVSEWDLIVFIGQEVCQKVSSETLKAKCKKVLIGFKANWKTSLFNNEFPQDFDLVMDVELQTPSLKFMPTQCNHDFVGQLLQQIALKWIINCLSTGAHILKGKVCGNLMVDVRTSNTKLYLRAIGIIQQFSNESPKVCEESLLKSIYDREDIDTDIWSRPKLDHIKLTEGKDMVVPVAIMLACQRCSLKEAKQMIKKEPIIRKLLMKTGN